MTLHHIYSTDDIRLVSPEKAVTLSGSQWLDAWEKANLHDELVAALRELEAFVGVMHGVGPDANFPETITTPLGIPINLGEIMRQTSAVLAKLEGASHA